MASLPSILTILFLFIHFSSPLQVTPNSPCASVCVDSNDLDYSDPNSSNTLNKDISCHDKDYTNTGAGQKFRRCLSCLQDSTFSQGSETDQGWFLCTFHHLLTYMYMCARTEHTDTPILTRNYLQTISDTHLTTVSLASLMLRGLSQHRVRRLRHAARLRMP